MLDEKVCTRCGQEQLLGQFNKNKNRDSGFSDWCKSCVREYGKKRYTEIRDKWPMYQVEKRYGKGAWSWKVPTWEANDKQCQICREPLPTLTDAHLDHDHNTGKWRGVLCHTCNVKLIAGVDRLQNMGFSVDDVMSILFGYYSATDRGDSA